MTFTLDMSTLYILGGFGLGLVMGACMAAMYFAWKPRE